MSSSLRPPQSLLGSDKSKVDHPIPPFAQQENNVSFGSRSHENILDKNFLQAQRSLSRAATSLEFTAPSITQHVMQLFASKCFQDSQNPHQAVPYEQASDLNSKLLERFSSNMKLIKDT